MLGVAGTTALPAQAPVITPAGDREPFAGAPDTVYAGIDVAGAVTWADVARWYAGLARDRATVAPALATKLGQVRRLTGMRGVLPPDKLGDLLSWLDAVSKDDSKYLVIDRAP